MQIFYTLFGTVVYRCIHSSHFIDYTLKTGVFYLCQIYLNLVDKFYKRNLGFPLCFQVLVPKKKNLQNDPLLVVN